MQHKYMQDTYLYTASKYINFKADYKLTNENDLKWNAPTHVCLLCLCDWLFLGSIV